MSANKLFGCLACRRTRKTGGWRAGAGTRPEWGQTTAVAQRTATITKMMCSSLRQLLTKDETRLLSEANECHF
ncbi:hypothetical protein E2C01_018896 [Portunus trituberculatus]|uniref:Uncharacterized protein n=1 Tax=Portunus trituberculatus TaxID=210409 RepID=A0A5B7DYB6_PORTR|nr:hypothetical protein [Portunus trituberculatus]